MEVGSRTDGTKGENFGETAKILERHEDGKYEGIF